MSYYFAIRRRAARVISEILLASFGFTQIGISAQLPGPPTGASDRIRIVVLQGFGATNFPKANESVVPVVSVLDASDRPIEGATVEFELPPTGPSATFAGGRWSLTTATNASGQAAAEGFRPNDRPGPFSIKVKATWKDSVASISFTQRNSLGRTTQVSRDFAARPMNKSNAKWWVVTAILAGGVAGGVYFATSHSGNSAAKPISISVQSGAVTVGAP